MRNDKSTSCTREDVPSATILAAIESSIVLMARI